MLTFFLILLVMNANNQSYACSFTFQSIKHILTLYNQLHTHTHTSSQIYTCGVHQWYRYCLFLLINYPIQEILDSLRKQNKGNHSVLVPCMTWFARSSTGRCASMAIRSAFLKFTPAQIKVCTNEHAHTYILVCILCKLWM